MAVDLHSQALLTGFEQHDPFRAVTFQLPNMIRLIFDSALYKNPTDADRRNFIEHLVRHQAGVPGQITADAMLTHFTNDMGDIAQARGQAVDNANLNKALIAFGLQAYYEQTDAFIKEAYEKITGGVRFDRAMIAGDLDAIKGYGLYFLPYLQSRFSGETLNLITSQLPSLQDWFIASGASWSNVMAGNRPAFMLGADKQDQFTGSSRNDLIVGDDGHDLIRGRGGDDILIGGRGDDIYLIDPGDGQDTIFDKEGNNTLVLNGTPVKLGLKQPDGSYKSPDGKLTFTRNSPLTVTDGAGATAVIEGFTDGDFGIHLWDRTVIPNPTATLSGTTGPDTLNGTPAPEQISGLAGDDRLVGNAGNDTLNGGDGDDYLDGGAEGLGQMIFTKSAVSPLDESRNRGGL